MDDEQLWAGYFMSVVAGRHYKGNVTQSAQMADEMVKRHLAAFPDGRVGAAEEKVKARPYRYSVL